MSSAMAYALPAMQLVCNLVVPQTASYNITDGQVSVTGLVNITSSPELSPDVPQPFVKQLQPVILPDGYIPHPAIGAAYKVSRNQASVQSARDRCLEEGAHLAVIDSFIKFEYLMQQTTLLDIWVGIYRMWDDTVWVSATTGSTIATIPWTTVDPGGEYDCVRTSRNPRGLRNDSCRKELNYVCEIPIPEGCNT